jgi:FAD/FMN-containing dehydrogenase
MQITLANTPWRELLARLQGHLILPDDPAYDPARTVFYGGSDRRPAAIAQVVNAQDVSAVITFARTYGLDLAIRSGGHSLVHHSLSDGGVVIDLRQMREITIDPASRTAWAETGLTAAEFTNAADRYDLALSFGDTGSVGIGGITLGGGIGYLVRKHGLTIDSLLAAEIVTAAGQILTVDATHHPELFWALRGGGGNFGVVTRFKFQLHPLGQVFGGMLILPAAADVITGFMAAAQAAPDELSTILNVMPAPPMPFLPPEAQGKLIALALLVYAGDAAEGERVVAPLRQLAPPLADMLRPMRYPEMFQPEDDTYHPTAVSQVMFLDHVDAAAAATILAHLEAGDAPMRIVQLRALGGALARVPEEATAFEHRQSKIMASVAAFYDRPEEQRRRQTWVNDFTAALQQDDRGAYVNFLGASGPARVHAAYPERTWRRLAAVKARYDPTNLFHLNHNIPPARLETPHE